MPREPGTPIRVAAVGDLHCRDDQHGRFRPLVRRVNEEAQLLLLCGDLTDRGTAREAKVLAEELAGLRIPAVAVLGNHDYDHGEAPAVVEQLALVGVHCLDGQNFVFDRELGVAGVKGFCGGFGACTLQAFGEELTKAFVREAVSEALKLEYALGQLRTPRKVVILHYSPILATTEGEHPELRPFLGSGRLAGAISRYGADAVFHGHAHYGSPAGRLESGAPVYNVAMPLLRREDPERRFLLVQL